MLFQGHISKTIVWFCFADSGIRNDFTLENIVFIKLISILFH